MNEPRSCRSRTCNQSDQIGRFLNAKEAQMFGNFLGYFKKTHFYVKTLVATFGKTWANC